MSEETKISMLAPGDRGVITGYEKQPGPYRERILSMGLTKGTEFKLTKKAPMGDPIEIEVLGYKLTLRKVEAEIIKIEKIGKEASK
ncbi:MAG TPA: FeoA family protein [Spirochaetota bacterium]|nr:FeoA family protein [Spirochaetota bacterium]HPF05764.1 FeoA family protein [Spirochaetota bacterium]HPJ42489.1 FeoA family protein [Spirochaetota bacterium]HPR37422.1 FeoA family protein [Spirochaetota bacterium]HRX47319.1 FeoA family protein [Spirochaetota bacterium]